MMKFNRISTAGRDPIGNEAALFNMAKGRFAQCAQWAADKDEIDERDWLRVWSGSQWGDEAPNRLFGSWLNQDGEAV